MDAKFSMENSSIFDCGSAILKLTTQITKSTSLDTSDEKEVSKSVHAVCINESITNYFVHRLNINLKGNKIDGNKGGNLVISPKSYEMQAEKLIENYESDTTMEM